jgi:hypothetical protein
MRYFDLLNLQHFILYILPAAVSIIVFAVGLGFYYVRRPDSSERENQIIEEYPGGIQGRNAPFPMVVTLIIAGTVVWAVAYILLIGILGVKI